MLLLAWLLFLAWLASAALAVHARAQSASGAGAAGTRRARRAAAVSTALILLGVALYRGDLAMQKLAGFLAMPSGALWLALLALTAWLLGRGLRHEGAALGALFLAYTLLGNQALAVALMAQLEASVPMATVADCPPLDAVLVLGGGAAPRGGDGEAQLGDFGDRVMAGARLYHAGKVKVLVTSGSSIPGLGPPADLSQATLALWTGIGIPPAAVRRLPDPKNTTQEIAALKALAAQEGWTRLGVLSSAWHLPRAAALLRRHGLQAQLIGADFRGAEPMLHPAGLVPQPGAWRVLQLAAWELLGRAVGR